MGVLEGMDDRMEGRNIVICLPPDVESRRRAKHDLRSTESPALYTVEFLMSRLFYSAEARLKD